ncbi:MAG: glycosyltransferase family 4 protein [Verrucomicrobiae bacterium]|nr:glycosyltransferase family 4 protein [Verrucomicrobiae bacterium]
MRVGYSATIWDERRSGIGIYIAEQLAVFAKIPEIEVEPIEYGGRILPRGEMPRASGTSQGVSNKMRPLRDILWHRRTLAGVARDRRWQLVHIPTIRRLPSDLPCPWTVTVHDLGPLRIPGKYGALRHLYHSKIVPRWLAQAAAIITPSEATKKDLAEIHRIDPARVTVVLNGINHALYKPGNREQSAANLAKRGIRRPFFLYISRLEHPAKNHARLLEAFDLFKKSTGAPHRLVLVGAPWNGHDVIHAAHQRMKFKDEVTFTGYVEPQALPDYLRACEALVYPSLFEGFGLPVLEAMACGTPVACSRSSSLTEIAEGRALLFDPYEPGDIASALATLSKDVRLREKFSAEGIPYVSSFTWERSARETLEVWSKVVEASK